MWWRVAWQQVPPWLWYISTKLQGATFKEAVILMFTSARTRCQFIICPYTRQYPVVKQVRSLCPWTKIPWYSFNIHRSRNNAGEDNNPIATDILNLIVQSLDWNVWSPLSNNVWHDRPKTPLLNSLRRKHQQNFAAIELIRSWYAQSATG